MGSVRARGNLLDAIRIATLRADGWLPLFRLRSICDKRLQAELCTSFQSAAAARLDVVSRTIASRLQTTSAIVKIKQDVVLAVDASAFVARNLKKVEFFTVLVRATVADILENGFVLGHLCGHRPRSSEGGFIKTKLTFSPP